MNDFSDLFFTMASIVIFSILLLQANHFMLRNDIVMVDHEYESIGIALAQSIIDEARNKPFDEALADGIDPDDMPGAFREERGPHSGMTRPDFGVFDHYHGYQDTVSTQLGPFAREVTVTYVESEPPFEPTNQPTYSKKITAEVRRLQSEKSVRLSYIKTYY